MRPYVEMFLKPASRVRRKISDEELLAFERVNPGHVIHLGTDRQGNDILEIFFHENEILERTLRAIVYIQNYLDPHEITKLRDLARLARDLQATQKETLMASLGVERENEGDLLIQAVIQKIRGINGVSISSSTATELFPVVEPTESASSVSTTQAMEKKAKKRKVKGAFSAEPKE